MDNKVRPTLIVSPYTDPTINLAFEEALVCQQAKDRHTLFLYQNDNTIVIGCNQNPWKECKVKAFEAVGGKVVRRQSGGGAVFHDMGNLNFSFIRSANEHLVEDNYQFVKNALSKLGFKVAFNGKNDLVIDDKKFSGSAFYEEDENFCHHGTLLVHTNLSKLSEYLTPSKIKIESKAIASVRSRVVNLCEIRPNTSVAELKKAFMDTFQETYKPYAIEHLDMVLTPDLKQRIEAYQSPEWIYDQSPNFNMRLEQRFNWGTFEIAGVVRNGIIEAVKCYTDAMEIKVFRAIEDNLMGCRFHAIDMINCLENVHFDKKIIEDITELFKTI